jgi:hypothetical protein
VDECKPLVAALEVAAVDDDVVTQLMKIETTSTSAAAAAASARAGAAESSVVRAGAYTRSLLGST